MTVNYIMNEHTLVNKWAAGRTYTIIYSASSDGNYWNMSGLFILMRVDIPGVQHYTLISNIATIYIVPNTPFSNKK